MYTGNSSTWLSVVTTSTVYPCVYRELIELDIDSLAKVGLSLCIQGTRFDSAVDFVPNRFIPVYTGNSSSKNRRELLCSVYPCVYRELPVGDNFPTRYIGLSLCIQGTL